MILIDQKTSETLVSFDNVLEEKYFVDNQVSEFPVESGYPISDHVQKKQQTIEITGEISNHPIDSDDGSPRRDKQYFNTFENIVNKATVLTAILGLSSFKNMILKSYTIPRDYTTGQVLRITLKLVKIEFAELEFVEIPPEILHPKLRSSGASQRTNSKTASKVDDPPKESILYSLFKG